MQNRRSFIKKSLVASAATLVLPTILPSCVKWKGANDRLQIGFIGLGSRGTDEMKFYFLPHDDFRCVATADVFKSRAAAGAKLIVDQYQQSGIANPACSVHQDYRELLDRKDIDMVAITTCDHWHLPNAIHAVQAGKHVHVNKPLGLSYAYMLKLKNELKNTKLKFNYGTQQRSYTFMKKAVEMIQSGAIGEVKEVMAWAPGGGLDRHIGYFKAMPVPEDLDYNTWLGPAPDAPYTADRVHRDGSFFINDYSIGFLGGWGAHPLDILVMALRDRMQGNMTVGGTGAINWPEGSMYNNINQWDVSFKYEEGLKLRFMSQDLAKPEVMKWQSAYRQNGTLFIGTKGWLTLSRTYAESDLPELTETLNAFPKKEWGLDGDRGTHGQEFAKLIRGEVDQYMDVDDAILSDMISHLSNASIRLNQSLQWDAQGGEVRNNQKANDLLNRDHRAPFDVS